MLKFIIKLRYIFLFSYSFNYEEFFKNKNNLNEKNLSNDEIKTILGEDTNFCFKDVKCKFKKVASHDYVEELKKCKYSDVIKMECSV